MLSKTQQQSASPEDKLTSRETRLDKVRRFLFGDDVFISYSRRDTAYALALADKLTHRKLSCFIDLWGAPAGVELPAEVVERLSRSSMLVLVGTRNAATSENVMKEMLEFKKTKRPIIPITFVGEEVFSRIRNNDVPKELKGTLEDATWYDEIAGIARTAESAERLKPSGTDDTVTPSTSVITRVVNAKGFLSRSRRLRKMFWLSLMTFFVLLTVVAATAFALVALAEAKTRQAEELEREAKFRAEETARVERGTQATIMARTPGREFEGVEVATEAAKPEVAGTRPSAPQVVEGLVNAVSAAGDAIPLRGTHGAVTYTQISPDGSAVFVETYEDGIVAWGVWDARKGRQLNSLEAPQLQRELRETRTSVDPTTQQTIARAFFSGGAGLLAAFGQDGSLRVWDLRTLGAAADLSKPQPPSSSFTNLKDVSFWAFNEDGSRLALLAGAGRKEAVLKVVDTKKFLRHGDVDGSVLEKYDIYTATDEGSIRLIGFTHDGAPVVFGGTVESEFLYFPRTTERQRYLGGVGRAIGFSDDGTPIIKYEPGGDPRLPYYEEGGEGKQNLYTGRGENSRAYFGYAGSISSAAVVGGLARVVSITGGQARVYGLRKGGGLPTLRGYNSTVWRAAFSVDGARAVVVSSGQGASPGEGLLWDLQTDQPPRRLEFSSPPSTIIRATAAAFSSDGSRLAMITNTAHVPEVWDLVSDAGGVPRNVTASGCDSDKAPEHLDPAIYGSQALYFQPKASAFLPDGQGRPGNQRFVTLETGGYIAVWEVGKCGFEEYQLGEHAMVIALSADGTTALTIKRIPNPANTRDEKGSTLAIWDLKGLKEAGGAPLRLTDVKLEPLPAGEFAAASIKGRDARVLLLKADGQLELWRSNVRTTTNLGRPAGAIHVALISPDGSKVAVMSRNFNKSVAVEVWDAETGKQLLSIPGDYYLKSLDERFLGSGLLPGFGSPLTFSVDGSQVLVEHADHTVRVYPTTPRGFFDVADNILKQ